MGTAMQGRVAYPAVAKGHLLPATPVAGPIGKPPCRAWSSRANCVRSIAAISSSSSLVDGAAQAGDHQHRGGNPQAERDKSMDFKYTTVAFKTEPKKPRKGTVRWGGGRSRSSHHRAAKSEGGPAYRAFEAVEGSSLPLMILDGADLPVVEDLQPGGVAAPHHTTPATSSQEAHPAATTTRRSHRRADNVVHRVTHVGAAVPVHTPSSQLHTAPAMPQRHGEPHLLLPPAIVPPNHQAEQPELSQFEEGAPSLVSQQVAAHLRACSKLLRLTPHKLSRMHELQAVLLRLTSTDALRTQLQQTARLLQLQHGQVLQLVSAHPDLLLTPLEHLQQRSQQVSLLFNASGVHTKKLQSILCSTPQLLTTSHTPQEAMLGLARCLAPSIGMQGVVQLLYTHPQLLIHPGAPSGRQFADVLDCLSAQLELPPAEVASSLTQQVPEVLLRSPGAVREVLRTLAAQWQLQPVDLAQLVGARPTLLLLSPGSAKVQCVRVKSLLGRSSHWRPDLPRLPVKPVALAKVLDMEFTRFDRLDYLVSTQRDRGIHWFAALNMLEEDWHDMYPAFMQWWTRTGR